MEKPVIPFDENLFYNTLREHLHAHHLSDPTVVAFITSYLSNRSLSQSAKECNISYPDAKYLFSQGDIYKTIEALTKDAVVQYGYDAAEVVERTKEIAFLDPVGIENPDGSYKKHLKDIPPELRRAIKKLKVKNIFSVDMNGIKTYAGEIIEYEFWDKPRTLELLGREKDTFKKTTVVQHDVSKNAREYLLGSLQRADESVKQIRDVTPDTKPEPAVSTRHEMPKPGGVE